MAAPVIYNVTCTEADTEYNQEIDANLAMVYIQVRGSNPARVAFTSGVVATPDGDYWTLRADMTLPIYLPQSVGAVTIYCAADDAGTVVEIWGTKKQ